jgi:predicted nucleic acid-binding protein
VSGVIADTSVWIDFLAGRPTPSLEEALARSVVVLPPIVVGELVSGARRAGDRAAIEDLLRELPIHETPRSHWVRVGDLRRMLRTKGVTVSTPDAHVAQCAIDRDAILLARDAIFPRIARHSGLRLGTP